MGKFYVLCRMMIFMNGKKVKFKLDLYRHIKKTRPSSFTIVLFSLTLGYTIFHWLIPNKRFILMFLF